MAAGWLPGSSKGKASTFLVNLSTLERSRDPEDHFQVHVTPRLVWSSFCRSASAISTSRVQDDQRLLSHVGYVRFVPADD